MSRSMLPSTTGVGRPEFWAGVEVALVTAICQNWTRRDDALVSLRKKGSRWVEEEEEGVVVQEEPWEFVAKPRFGE